MSSRAKTMMPEDPAPVDQDMRRRAAHAVSLHRQRNGSVSVWPVDPNGKCQPVFMNEGLKRHRRHGCMMLEHRVKTDDLKIARREYAARPFSLWRTVRYAAGAQHLEGVQQHNTPAQTGQADWRRRVEPAIDNKLRCECL